jgi:hypothetical protein
MARYFYIVRCDLPRPELIADWDRWYVGHLQLLLTVPGFLAAQRFTTHQSPDGRPYLALYRLSSPEVLRSDAYERARGFGGWEAHVTKWTRDLVEDPRDTLDFATPPGERLWATFEVDGAAPEAARTIGLDRSFPAASWRRLESREPVPAPGGAVYEPRTAFHAVDTPPAHD